MEINQIIDFVGKRNVAVYGAGILGQALTEILHKYGVSVMRYVVSEEQNIKNSYQNGIPVQSLSVWRKGYDKENDCLLISLSEYYRTDIEKLLVENGIVEYLWVDRDLFPAIIRELRPVISNDMLVRIEPVSRAFGCERGKPIDRYYIEKFLRVEAPKFQYAKTILEVGEDTYSKKFFPEARIYDILDYRTGMDLTEIDTLPKSQYDVFICTQVFNFIYDVKAAIKGAYYLLKDRGVMLATVMGPVAQVSTNDMRRWGDYWRFTNRGIEQLMRETFGDEVRVVSYGNAPIATAWIQGMCLEDLPDQSLIDVEDDAYAINIGICVQKNGEEGFFDKLLEEENDAGR